MASKPSKTWRKMTQCVASFSIWQITQRLLRFWRIKVQSTFLVQLLKGCQSICLLSSWWFGGSKLINQQTEFLLWTSWININISFLCCLAAVFSYLVPLNDPRLMLNNELNIVYSDTFRPPTSALETRKRGSSDLSSEMIGWGWKIPMVI